MTERRGMTYWQVLGLILLYHIVLNVIGAILFEVYPNRAGRDLNALCAAHPTVCEEHSR